MRLLFASLFLLAPLAVGAIVLWKLIPSHAVWMESRGALLPWSARTLVFLGRAFETSGVLILSFRLGLAFFLLVSRILWVTSDSPREMAGA